MSARSPIRKSVTMLVAILASNSATSSALSQMTVSPIRKNLVKFEDGSRDAAPAPRK